MSVLGPHPQKIRINIFISFPMIAIDSTVEQSFSKEVNTHWRKASSQDLSPSIDAKNASQPSLPVADHLKTTHEQVSLERLNMYPGCPTDLC